VQGSAVAGLDQLGGAQRRDLREAADAGEQQRLAEGQRGGQHARLVDLTVGEHHQVGPPEVGRQLGVGHVAGDEAHAGSGARAQGAERHARHPHDPQLGASHALPGVQQDLHALVGAQQPEEQDHRAVHRLELGGQRRRRQLRQVVEGAVRDDVDPLGVDLQVDHQALAPVMGVDDHRVGALVEPPLGGALARPGLAGQHVVGGDHQRPPPGKQASVEGLHRQPLEVHDVGAGRRAAVAQHVRDVLRQLRRTPHARPGGPRRPAVERLAHLVTVLARGVPVVEARGDQLHARAGTRQRRAQGVVVGRRVGGGVDYVDPHGGHHRAAVGRCSS